MPATAQRLDRRKTRLAEEHSLLQGLQAISNNRIEIQPVDQRRGRPPEKYLVTLHVKGIASISPADQSPVFSNLHKVEIEIPDDYPGVRARLRWLTPIWHPNIDHKSGHVCTNEGETHDPSKRLRHYVEYMALMAQYKIYHAEMTIPYPWDMEAATWVREIAEKRGYLGPSRPVDPTEIFARSTLKFQKIKRLTIGAAAGK